MSDIRYDQLRDTHVIIAPERLHRPEHFKPITAPKQSTLEHCPFCEGNEAYTPEEICAIREAQSPANARGWKSRVVPNLYKAVSIEAPFHHHMEGLLHRWEGFGAHEVIIDTPQHHAMGEWSEQEFVNWLTIMQSRINDLKKDGRIAHISLFKNQGVSAGGTQPHPHSQLIAVPIVPKEQRERYERANAYYQDRGEASIHALIKEEIIEGERIVDEEGAFVAFCPFASAYAFEVMIAPKTEALQIDTMSEASIQEIGTLLKRLFGHLHKELGDFDYNVLIATPPLHHVQGETMSLEQMREASPFALRIIPRLYREGGFELSTGVYINPVAPETAAKLLRESLNA